MTIYEIDQAMLSLVDQETGELKDLEAFESLQMERDKKVENMALWYKDLKAQAEAIKAEISTLTDRKQLAERKAARLLDYIGVVLNGEKFQTARCAVSYRNSKSLSVDDAERVILWAKETGNEQCIRFSAPAIHATEVKKIIESGVDVPGAHIEQKRNVGVK